MNHVWLCWECADREGFQPLCDRQEFSYAARCDKCGPPATGTKLVGKYCYSSLLLNIVDPPVEIPSRKPPVTRRNLADFAREMSNGDDASEFL